MAGRELSDVNVRVYVTDGGMRSSEGWLKANLKPQTKAQLNRLAKDWEREAKSRAPVRTGRLKRSIRGHAGQKSVGLRAAGYGRVQEFGVPGRFKAQPFIRPAWNAVKREAQKEVREAAGNTMQKGGLPVK